MSLYNLCVTSPRARRALQSLPALILLCLLQICPPAAVAQTIDDGMMTPARTVFGGYLYTHDSWDQYWEGQLKRSNGNIGTLTTQTSTISLDLGVTDRLNVFVLIPHVTTDASQGVLASQSGWQDLTVAAKFKAASVKLPRFGKLNVFGVGYWTIPMTNYTPDFLPLSIGSDSLKRGLRTTLCFDSNLGFYFTGTAAYTWREDVTLDRPYYFTNNQFFLTSDVPLPSVVDYAATAGFDRKRRMLQATFSKLITRGGIDSGDIRRQDQPFVSNRMIASRIGGMIMYPVPFVKGLDFHFEYSHVFDGRNVGQSNTYTIGLMRTQQLGLIIHACTCPKKGSIGGRGGVSKLFQGISPRAVAAAARASHCA